MKKTFLALSIFVLFTPKLFAFPTGPEDCGHMEAWDYSSGMCMPFAMPNMAMKMVMLHGNSFFTQTIEEKPRGRDAFSVPNMFMIDVGSSIGSSNYLNLDFMGTLERWTFPKEGYPELLQIGEENEDRRPFIDAQHPHSSPVMGLTLSDTISLSHSKDHLKLFIAPRGQATEGPIAFMHRPTGMVNPDAPLGHHIGQDVGHIASTVVGAELRLQSTTIEASTFHGEEPAPTKVDLPLGRPDSYAVRLTEQFNQHIYAMASAAFVKKPESHDEDLDHIWRYSSSLYFDSSVVEGWKYFNTLIWGLVNDYDHASSLNSFNEEFWLMNGARNFWGRLEVLQRTPAELAINDTNDVNRGRWVSAATLGYTHRLASWDSADIGLGGSVTKDFLPNEFQRAYGGDPVSVKVFLQLSGMKMWHL